MFFSGYLLNFLRGGAYALVRILIAGTFLWPVLTPPEIKEIFLVHTHACANKWLFSHNSCKFLSNATAH